MSLTWEDDDQSMARWVKSVIKELRAYPDDWALTRNLQIEERAGRIWSGMYRRNTREQP